MPNRFSHQHIEHNSTPGSNQWQCQARACRAKGTLKELEAIACKSKKRLTEAEIVDAIIADPRDE